MFDRQEMRRGTGGEADNIETPHQYNRWYFVHTRVFLTGSETTHVFLHSVERFPQRYMTNPTSLFPQHYIDDLLCTQSMILPSSRSRDTCMQCRGVPIFVGGTQYQNSTPLQQD